MRLVVVGLLLIGCTKPNPRSCLDGFCTDPAFPFCDVDGTFGGLQNECIAVACEPEQFESCRGDIAVTCNGVGNDFDLISCPLGCDPGFGCKACSNDDQCSNPTPICEVGMSCRVCKEDDECPSQVCEAGSCVSVSDVVYAAPTGSSTSDCTLDAPCNVDRAFSLATGAIPQPIVRLLPGAYLVGLSFSAPTVSPLEIVGTGASIGDFTAMTVTEGADVKVRGIELIGRNLALSCGQDAINRAKLTVVDSSLAGAMATSNALGVENCDVVVTATRFVGTADGSVIIVGNDAHVVGDRVHLTGSQPRVVMIGDRMNFELTNSVLEDPEFVFLQLNSNPPGSVGRFGFNTIVLTTPSSTISCVPDPQLVPVFENNILVAIGTNMTSVADTNGCTFTNNIMTPQVSTPAGNLVVDPQFVDVAAKNYRVQPSSPAVGAASLDPLISTDHDFEGTSRPQGGASDIGAFEQ